MNEEITIDDIDIDSFDTISPEMNDEVQEIVMTMGESGLMEAFAGLAVASLLVGLLFHLLGAWGLWNINKKFGEKYSWMSWIPLLQIYSVYTASGKEIKYLYMLIISYVLMFIPILGLVAMFVALYSYIVLLGGISKRTKRGGWTTAGLFFIPFVMFPVVGSKLDASDIQSNSEKKTDLQEKYGVNNEEEEAKKLLDEVDSKEEL